MRGTLAFSSRRQPPSVFAHVALAAPLRGEVAYLVGVYIEHNLSAASVHILDDELRGISFVNLFPVRSETRTVRRAMDTSDSWWNVAAL